MADSVFASQRGRVATLEAVRTPHAKLWVLVFGLTGCTGESKGDDLAEGETSQATDTSSSESTATESTSSSESASETTSDTTDTSSDTTDTSSDTTDTSTDTTTGGGECPGAQVGVCASEPASDLFTVEATNISGDCLELDVSYGGGCTQHTFTSCWDESFAESNPVQAWLWIDHDAMNDPCDGILQDTWTLDLSALKQAWQTAYQSQTGTIMLHVAGETIQYDF